MTTGRTQRGATLLGLLAWAAGAASQTVERDVTITGPRGNSIERHVRTERRGNVVDRQIDIRRPEGTYHRDTEVIVPPGHRGRPFVAGGGEAYVGGGGYRGPAFIERDVIVERPAPFVAAPFFSFFVGSPPPPPPPAFVVAPSVVVPIQPGPPPRPAGVDQAADAIGDLQSFHMRTRREAAVTLGKLRDPRGVPPLIDRLKHDHDKEVRMASAWALAEIGDPRAIVPLEVAAQFDKKPDVKAVAEKSLARMPREDASAASQPSTSSRVAAPSPSQARTSRAARPEPRYNLDDLPPPDPTPAGPRSEPGSGFDAPR